MVTMLRTTTQFDVLDKPLPPVESLRWAQFTPPTTTVSPDVGLSRTERMLLRSAMMGLLQEQKAAMALICRRQPTVPNQARQLIGDEGHFGVQRSSERMMALVETVAGRQEERYVAVVDEMLRNIERIQRQPRAELPQLALDTLNNVQQTLNTWWSGRVKHSA